MGDAAWKDWCKGEERMGGSSQLQDHAAYPPRSWQNAATMPQPLIHTHQRPVSATPPGLKPVPYKLKTDHIGEYRPPSGIPRKPHVDPNKYVAITTCRRACLDPG